MGANDPIRTTTTPGSDLLATTVTAAVGLALSDRSGGALLSNPVIASGFLSREKIRGALGGNKVYLGLGADKFASAAEGVDFSVLTLASSKSTVTPARMGFARQISDMFRALD
ncbi:MAG: hypothetical protein D6798_00170, partial [Deltaproteobacteria bacterium]